MQSKQPLISVCIPAYNNERFIKETISCIINQRYTNWELVIADDCSKDNTVAIIKSFNDPRIRLIEHKINLGLVGNWNSLIKELKGEYVKLVCGDDLITSTCLEKQIAVFLSDKYPTVQLVTSYTDLIDENGKKIFTRKNILKSGLIPSKKAIRQNFIFGKNTIGEPSCGLYKKEVFEKIGMFDDSNFYTVDIDFWFRILLLGDLYIVPESLASFRINKEATSTKIKNIQAKLFQQFAKKIYIDKRFNISIFLYYIACVSSFMMQFLRRIVLTYYIK